MSKKITAMAAKQSWARAKKLLALAETGTPTQARKFLSTHKKTKISGYTYDELLDLPKTDKRNPAIRSIIEEYTNSIKDRPAKGDPTKPVRAGAPKTHNTKRGGQPGTKTDPGTDPNTITGDALLDLRHIQRKYGLTIDDLAYYTKVLGDLI